MQEHAQKQEQHIEQRQHHPLVGREITDRLGQRLWRLDLGQIGAQQGAGGDQQHDDGCLYAALEYGFLQLFEVEFTVNEQPDNRSEEHTSELQSLMRISYAVFCLKKKKH